MKIPKRCWCVFKRFLFVCFVFLARLFTLSDDSTLCAKLYIVLFLEKIHEILEQKSTQRRTDYRDDPFYCCIAFVALDRKKKTRKHSGVLKMRKLSKKGIADKQLLYLLIGVAVFLTLFFFGVEIAKKMYLQGGTTTCAASVLAAQQTGNIVSLECPRSELVLSTDGYTLNGKSYSYFKKDSEEFSDNANKIIASEMKNCWDQFGKGKINIFGTALPIVGSISTASSLGSCLICDSISFDEEVPQDSLQLLSSLQNTQIPLGSSLGEQITYYDYLYTSYTAVSGTTILGTENPSSPYISESGILSPTQQYTLLYDTIQSNYYLMLIPSIDISKVCVTIHN